MSALSSDAGITLRCIGVPNKEVSLLSQQAERLNLNTVEARLLHLLRTESDAQGCRWTRGSRH